MRRSAGASKRGPEASPNAGAAAPRARIFWRDVPAAPRAMPPVPVAARTVFGAALNSSAGAAKRAAPRVPLPACKASGVVPRRRSRTGSTGCARAGTRGLGPLGTRLCGLGRGLRRARRGLLQFGIGPPEHQHLSQVLDGRAFHVRAYLFQHRLALVARIAEHADLDQLVLQQRQVDLVQDRRRKTMLADGDERLQVVRLGAQFAATGGGQWVHAVSL